MKPLRKLAATLKFRLALASVVLITACVALSTQLALNRVHAGVERAVMDLETGNAERMAGLVSSRIVAMQMALRSLADDPAFIGDLAGAPDPAAAGERLKSNRVLLSMFASIVVIRPDGHVVAARDQNGPREVPLNVADRPYFQQTLKQQRPVVSEPIVGRVMPEPLILLTVPVMGNGGELVGVLAGTLRLASRHLLDDLTQGAHVADDPVTTLVIDSQGRILSHRSPERVLKAADTEPGLAPAMARWVQQGRPIEAVGDVVQAGGKIVASAGVPAADWVVLRLSDEEVLLGGVASARRDSLRVAAVVAVAGGLVLLALLGWLLRPLARLQRRALALGNAELPIDEGWPAVHGEIGQLSAVLRQAMRDRRASERDAAGMLRKLQSVMAAAPIGIVFARRKRMELVSHEFAALLGWDEGQLVGRPAGDIHASKLDYEQLGPQVRAAFAAGRPYVGEMLFQRRDGSTVWCRLQGRPVIADDADAGTIWLLEDVTVQRAERERLSWSANHDALTRLANRASFESSLAALLAREPHGQPSALLFVDLDRFKRINDNAGHAAGDEVLKEMAALLLAQVRGGDLVARLGGDEFGVLLPHCERAVALRIADKIRLGAQQIGVEHGGRRLTIGASIGAVEIDGGELSLAELLSRADVACYEAKRAGRDAVRLAEAAARPLVVAVP